MKDGGPVLCPIPESSTAENAAFSTLDLPLGLAIGSPGGTLQEARFSPGASG